VTACAFRADARKIGLAGVEDEPGGPCDSTDLSPSLFGCGFAATGSASARAFSSRSSPY
jgi:hypothetical protein